MPEDAVFWLHVTKFSILINFVNLKTVAKQLQNSKSEDIVLVLSIQNTVYN